jgi:protein SCO1/2
MISLRHFRSVSNSALSRLGLTAAATIVAALPALAQPTMPTDAKGATPPAAEQPKLPGRVAIAQKLNTQVPLNLAFRDETGKPVQLKDYFGKGRPVVLTFMYFRCPMLCSMVLEGTTNAMSQMKFDLGRDFDMITVSIDPRDKPEAAAAMKDKYVKRYGRLTAASGWHFLTGYESAIEALAESTGFQYAYDPATDQFAHGAAILVLTPEGRISRYFYGFEYKPRDLRLALAEASQNKIGGVAEQIMLLCFHYDPATGTYSKNAMTFVRAGGVATVLVLAGMMVIMLRRDRRIALTLDDVRRGDDPDGPAAR